MTDPSSESTAPITTDIVDVTERSITERVRDFSDLLNNIEDLDDKKRQLWKEIYCNAIADRQNSYAMFAKLVRICEDKSTEMAIHAKAMTSFVERMSKANDQLIRLAELIAKTQASKDDMSPDDIFDRIRKDN